MITWRRRPELDGLDPDIQVPEPAPQQRHLTMVQFGDYRLAHPVVLQRRTARSCANRACQHETCWDDVPGRYATDDDALDELAQILQRQQALRREGLP